MNTETRCPEQIWKDKAGEFLDIMDRKNNGDGMILREAVLHPRVLYHLGDISGKRLLDAGCGDGILGRLALEKGAQIVSCDIVEQFLRETRMRSNNKIRTVLTDLRQTLPFAPDSFDVVCCNLALMWIPEITQFAGETARIMKPNGRLVISLLHPWTALSQVEESQSEKPKLVLQSGMQDGVFMRTINKTAGPYPFYQRTIGEYIRTFSNAGFSLETKDGFDEVVSPKENNVSLPKKIFPEFLILTFEKSTGRLNQS